jgi:hypothetical protein
MWDKTPRIKKRGVGNQLSYVIVLSALASSRESACRKVGSIILLYSALGASNVNPLSDSTLSGQRRKLALAPDERPHERGFGALRPPSEFRR